ncbi:nitrate- and nitrite sensing domain-containing protein [Actinoplanes sp. TRM 88003]|uniref:histidine kinase n=1 Tax=Paractinoplanes aksuensis TaxID=2939490 RepID=A0ABT1DWY8_9ACTN|nr:nitrate- and nitrite sensing domain-containing protein [Actinoplanes aksuensis]MCO8275386.1 nitrate- and nitrite sensing domain-containing protein [Actinoplanes aksuensis]
MLLGRLRIRGKLTLLVMIPLLAMVGLVLPVVRGLVTDAGRATDIDNVATVAGRVGALLQDMQRERLLSVGYLLDVVSEDALALQTASVIDRIVDVRQDLSDKLPPVVRTEIDGASRLATVRKQVRSRNIPPQQVLDGFTPVLDGMIDSLGLVQRADADTAAGQQLIALDAVLRMDDSNTESTALLAIMAGGDVGRLSVRYHEERAEFGTYQARFATFATQPQRDLNDLVAAAFRDRVGDDFDARFAADPVRTMAALPIATLFPALQSFSALGGFVEKRLVDDVTSLVAKQRQEQLTIAYGLGALALAVLLAVLILAAIVARSVAVPLTRLSRSAARVADAGESELRRIADDDSEPVEPVRIEVLDVNSSDEIGDLARVFERVQSAASQLVERQVLSRRNVAEMFGHIGRRTQNLVGGQVGLIDELEHEEADPARLAKLYQLDHISNRLRRSADSLVVISGAERDQGHSTPARLVDVVRLALAEIEEYNRVDVEIPLDLWVAPALVRDLVLICAELLENATTFSPPHTRVRVSARPGPDGTRLVVADRGIGLPDERLAEENARIARRERLDLVPSQVLGLFVVGRLARRHGLTVALSHTDGGGVTVDVTLSGLAPASPAPSLSPPDGGAPRVEMVPTAYRSTPAPASEPRTHESRRAMARLSEVMQRDSRTWNGFEISPGQPSPAPEPEGRVLSRRVPGASLPQLEPPPPPRAAGPSAAAQDPDAARALVEQLDLGVTRALHEVTHRSGQ